MVLLLGRATRVVDINVDVDIAMVDEDRVLLSSRALMQGLGTTQVWMADRQFLGRRSFRPRLAWATRACREDHSTGPFVPEALHVSVEDALGPKRLLGLLSLRQ